MRATPLIPPVEQTPQTQPQPTRPPKPLPEVVDLAEWMGGNRRTIVFYDNSDVGTYPPKRRLV